MAALFRNESTVSRDEWRSNIERAVNEGHGDKDMAAVYLASAPRARTG